MDMDLVGIVHNPLHQMRRNEVHPLRVAHHHVTRHHGDIADPHRNVDPGQGDVGDGAGVRLAEVRGHHHLRNPFQVAYRAVHHNASSLGGLHNVVEKVIAYEGSPVDLAEQIHYQDIPRL